MEKTLSDGFTAFTNWAPVIGFLMLLLFGWTRSKNHGWVHWRGLLFSTLVVLGFAAGEGYYSLYHKMPWFFWIDLGVDKRTDINVLAALAVLLVIGTAFFRRYVTAGIRWWSGKSRLPGSVSPGGAAGLGLVLALVFFGMMGAYINKVTGLSPGRETLRTAQDLASTLLGATASLMAGDKDLIATTGAPPVARSGMLSADYLPAVEPGREESSQNEPPRGPRFRDNEPDRLEPAQSPQPEKNDKKADKKKLDRQGHLTRFAPRDKQNDPRNGPPR